MTKSLVAVLAALGALGATTACGSSDPVERTHTYGGDRPAELKTPATLTEGKKYPLILVLHGYGANGFAQAAYFNVSSLPNQDTAFVIAPDGTTDASNKQFWNADPACCDFGNTGVDDVAYLGGLLDDILADWPVDPDAVFVLGHSNGGFMAYRMACERADVIAGIVPLAGLASSNAAGCTPSRDVNVLHLHGTADATVPFAGGGGGIGTVGAEGSVMQWATKNGCGTTRTPGADLDLDTSILGAETHTAATTGCPAEGAVDLWSLAGSGHIPVFGGNFVPALLAWLDAHHRS